MQAYDGCSPTRSRAREPGHRRGEPPGAHPRQRGDGAVEQVRLAGAHHRQQVGAVGGLRHALRRHGRRLRRAQGRLQGQGLLAGRWRNAAGGPRAGARRRCSSARRRPSSATSSATRSHCRPTTCSTRSSRATWSRTSTPRSWCAAACPAEDVERVIRMVDRAEYKRRQAPPGIRSHQGVRARPAAADHEPLPSARPRLRTVPARSAGSLGGRTAIVTREGRRACPRRP